MTGMSTFGDFISAAHWHLDPANRAHGPAGGRGGGEETARSLVRVGTVMGRFVHELGRAVRDVPSRTPRGLDPYPKARIPGRAGTGTPCG